VRDLQKLLNSAATALNNVPHLALRATLSRRGGRGKKDPQVKRQRTMDALKRVTLRKSLERPLVIIFEDLHWIDGETQALLDLLSRRNANAHVVLLVNYRPEIYNLFTEGFDTCGLKDAKALLNELAA
jgi:hypothetical protein